jgi:hypothetical protein
MLIAAEDLVPTDAAGALVVAAPYAFRRRSIVIDVAGIVCAVHFDSEDAAALFALRYADLIVGARVPERHAFAMHDRMLGWLFWSDDGPVLRWPHGDLPARVVAFLADAVALTACFQQREDGIVSLHAASAGLPGGVAAIIGDSHAGKTTTAVACARDGMALYSDERCLIDRRSLVHAFPRAINLRAAGLRLLARDRPAGADPIGARIRAHGAGDWHDVRVHELLVDHGELEPRPLCAVFVLAGSDATVGVESIPATRAARASMQWAQGAGDGMDKLARLYAIFASVPCYALRLGTPHASARVIRRIVMDCLERARTA